MASDLIKHVTDASFEADVLQSAQPILVDYWAEWCGPCKALGPVLEQIAELNQATLKVAKVNVDDCQTIAGKFGIRSIPTMMLFQNGELKGTLVGNQPKAAIEKFIREKLAA